MRWLVLSLVLGITFISIGQTVTDYEAIVQQTIDLAELQPYYRADEIDKRKPLIIFNDGMVPANLNLTKFGMPVEFWTLEQLFNYDSKAYLKFMKFAVTPSTAEVVFNYAVEGIQVSIDFEKVDGQWMIVTKSINKP